MVLYRGSHRGAAEQPSPDFKVPALEVAPSTNRDPLSLQG
jgi:hypothetical protein